MEVAEQIELRVLDGTGDTKFVWDPDEDSDVEAAQAQFDILKEKGFNIFKVGKDHEKTGGALKKFPKTAGKLIAVPKVVGG